MSHMGKSSIGGLFSYKSPAPKERVEVINGKKPIILVCPHGADDTNTGLVTKGCAKSLNCYAVINWGFERGEEVDVFSDKADCNRVDHVEQDVVREEFLEPIINIRRRIGISTPQGKSPYVYIYYIHGFGLQVEADMNDKIDLILGYGEAMAKPSHTCPHWVVDKLIYEWEMNNFTSGRAYCGKPGGRYSARNSNNLCQYFTRHMSDSFVRSVQIEVSQRLRATKDLAFWNGTILAETLLLVLNTDHFDDSLDRMYV